MDDDTVNDIAKKETARQAIILTFSLAGTIGTLWLVQALSEPDVWRTYKMRSALGLKRFAGWNVDFWQNISDKAATAYNKEKL